MNIRTLYDLIVNNFRLFAICITVCIAAAFAYLHLVPATYQRHAAIMITNDNRTIISESLKTSSNIANEIYTLATPQLMERVVDCLSLNSKIDEQISPLRWVERYPHPFAITLSNHFDTSTIKFTIATEAVKFDLHNITINNTSHPDITGGYGAAIELGDGLIIIGKPQSSGQYRYSKHPSSTTALDIVSQLTITQRPPSSSIIDLTLTAPTPRKAEDILNTLIAIYNESHRSERELTNTLSAEFIDQRLTKIHHELESADRVISNFKSDNLMPDITSATAFNIQNSSESSIELSQIENQLAIVRYIQSHSGGYIPNNIALSSPEIAKLIDSYNQISRRATILLSGSNTSNPITSAMIDQAKQQRELLQRSISEMIATLKIKERNCLRELEQSNLQLASKPKHELFLLSSDRQRSIKERLYIYLMQKREESEINSAYIPANSKVIEYASGSPAPISSSRTITYALALLLGIAVPATILVARESIDCAVRSTKDLEWLNIPIIGSIPYINSDGLNEQFRVVRSNLDFILNTTSRKVIQIISLLPDSGKSFITANLAQAMALRDQRILMIDGDLRKATLSAETKKTTQGLSSYLSGKCTDLEQIIISNKDLHIIPVGILPPNPAELLLSERFATLVSTLRDRYDYIIIDSPPAEILPDASIIAKHCDASIFVIRAGVLDRRLLPEVESIAQSGKYPPMSLLLNGAESITEYY